ncbi:MAG: hypothetical protein Q7U14_02585 [Lacisediminimonas sp.]|nr:hypothetical protein [Lacisediminimonas sp.]
MDSLSGEVVTMIALHCRDRKTLAAFLGTCSHFHGYAEPLLAPAKSLHAARVPERSLRLTGTLDAIAGFGRRICAQDWQDHLDAIGKRHADDAILMSLAVLVPGTVPHDCDIFRNACERLGDYHPGVSLGRLTKRISGPAQAAWRRVVTAVFVGAYEQAARMGKQWNILDFNMLIWTFQQCAASMPLDLTMSILKQMAEKGQLNPLSKENLVCQMLTTVAQLISKPGRIALGDPHATQALTGQLMQTLESIIRAARAQGSKEFIFDCASDAVWFVKLLPARHWRLQPQENFAWLFELTSAALLLDKYDQSLALVALEAAVAGRGIFSEDEWNATVRQLREGSPDLPQ